MPNPGKSVEVPRSEARIYLAKARQLLDEARSALTGARHDAAMLNAIHAGISAADSVTVALAGRRSSDPDHQRAVDLLDQAAGGSEEIATQVRQLGMLLAKKNVVEYESRRATAKEGAEAVRRADRFVRWAAEVVDRAKL